MSLSINKFYITLIKLIKPSIIFKEYVKDSFGSYLFYIFLLYIKKYDILCSINEL